MNNAYEQTKRILIEQAGDRVYSPGDSYASMWGKIVENEGVKLDALSRVSLMTTWKAWLNHLGGSASALESPNRVLGKILVALGGTPSVMELEGSLIRKIWGAMGNGPGPDPAFVMVIKTDHTGVTSSDQMLIPTSATGYDFEIDWGDGTTETLTDADIVAVGGVSGFLHTYPTAGEYTTRINGAFPRVYFNNAGDRLKVLSVHLGDGSFGWDDFVNSFWGCGNNSSVTGFIPEGIASLSRAWQDNNLTEWNIPLPESLTNCQIAWWNNNLTEWNIPLPESLTTCQSAWQNNNLTEWNIPLPESLTNCQSAWQNNNLTEWNIPLPESLTNCSYAWRNNNLTEWNISLPESLTNCAYAWYSNNLTSWTAGGSWKNITNADNAASQANINTADYSALLELIAATATQSNVPFNFGASQYNAAGEVARNYLINELSWTITDGGLAS